MTINKDLMEFFTFLFVCISGFYKVTKIESKIINRLDVHAADHKLIDFEIKEINKKLDRL